MKRVCFFFLFLQKIDARIQMVRPAHVFHCGIAIIFINCYRRDRCLMNHGLSCHAANVHTEIVHHTYVNQEIIQHFSVNLELEGIIEFVVLNIPGLLCR